MNGIKKLSRHLKNMNRMKSDFNFKIFITLIKYKLIYKNDTTSIQEWSS